MNEKIVEKIFPGTVEKIKNRICPTCNKQLGTFRNLSSKKEYEISGMCQKCQDKVFGTD